MDASNANTSRRAFFLNGGAALGAGVTATGVSLAGTAQVPQQQPPSQPATDVEAREQLACAQDREAIRQLHYRFVQLIEQRNYEAVAELFDAQATLALSGESASGRAGIAHLLSVGYREQTVAALHEAYRGNARQHQDCITLEANRLGARALWHVDVAIGTPLQGDCTAAQMARLQGLLAERRWEAGRLQARYVKRGEDWKLAVLEYHPHIT
ncbi:MAG: nuclear transport factor 2 family protein [Nevskiaceae bacterium]|nr:nuclear transport factor 2 family protein [Nevskiaceae bacterium]